MNNLLLDEPPLIFLPKLAKLLGSKQDALLLQQIHYWLRKNELDCRNLVAGHYWTYNSQQQWAKALGCSVSTIRRSTGRLEKRGFLITDDFNEDRWRRPKWYRIDYDRLRDFELSIMGTSTVQGDSSVLSTMDRSITETSSETNSKTNNPGKRKESDPFSFLVDAVEEEPTNQVDLP